MTIFYALAGIIGFTIFFAAMWTGILHLIAAIGGWSRLVRVYPGNALAKSGAGGQSGQAAKGQSYNWVSMQLGWIAQYSSVLTVSVTAQGLHIAPMIFFKIGHPPLLIPWAAIASSTSKRFLVFHGVSLMVRAKDGSSLASMTLYGKRLSQDVQDHWQRASAQSVV